MCARPRGFLTPFSLWTPEASSWTPSCHVTTWTECDRPSAREPDSAKGTLLRHASSTNAPVRPQRQTPSAVCALLFLWCARASSLILREKSALPVLIHCWAVCCLGYSVVVSQTGRGVNTTPRGRVFIAPSQIDAKEQFVFWWELFKGFLGDNDSCLLLFFIFVFGVVGGGYCKYRPSKKNRDEILCWSKQNMQEQHVRWRRRVVAAELHIWTGGGSPEVDSLSSL